MTTSVPDDTPSPQDATVAYQAESGHVAASSPLDVPQHVGRFEIRGVLGQGAFGRVYWAHDPMLDREVALKVPRFGPDEHHLMERFLREAKSAARLRHPNIVAVFEIGQEGEQPFIATEYVQGDPLSQRIAKDKPSLRQAAEWVRSLALALNYAHEEGIVHRDIKPSNIMVDQRQRVQLMDFGLAKQLNSQVAIRLANGVATAISDFAFPRDFDPTTTADGTLLGTPAYMAPEQARGELQLVGPHSDQYSLGVVLYELLTGQLPFRGNFDELRRQVADPAVFPDPPQAVNPEVPAPLAAICLKAMAKREAKRYRSLADLAIDLQRWLNNEPVSAWRHENTRTAWPRRLVAWGREHRTAALASAGVLVVVCVIAGWLLWLNARVRNADRTIEVARLAALGRESDLLRERGLRLHASGSTDEALLCLSEALALADELNDVERQRALSDAFNEHSSLLELKDVANRTVRQLAGSLLFAAKMPATGLAELEASGQVMTHAGAASVTAFGSGGDTVLTAEAISPNRSARGVGAQFHNASTGEAFGEPLRADEQIVFSPDARRAVRFGALAWSIWDLTTGQKLGPPMTKDWPLKQAIFNDDGTKLAVHWEDGDAPQTEVWDPYEIRALKPRFTHPGFERWKPTLLLDREAKTLLSVQANGSSAPMIRLWRRGSLARPPELPIEHTFAAFHPDGQHVMLGTKERLELYNLAFDERRELLPLANVSDVKFSLDRRWALTLAQGRPQLWDMTLMRPVGLPLEQLSGVTQIRFHPRGEAILTAGSGRAHLWPLPWRGADRTSTVRAWARIVTEMKLAPDGKPQRLSEAEMAESGRQLEPFTKGVEGR